MSEQPKIDPYPEPVAMTAINLAQMNRKQAEKGRADRLRRLARRNRDVWPGSWLNPGRTGGQHRQKLFGHHV